MVYMCNVAASTLMIFLKAHYQEWYESIDPLQRGLSQNLVTVGLETI
jgi:hypothetical protein